MALTAARIESRLLSEEGPLGAVLSEYRVDGARTRLTHPDGRFFDMTYRDNGAIRAIHEGTTSDYRLGLFGYDARNRLIDISPQAAPGRASQSFGYDPPSRLASIEHDLPASANDLTIGLGYNAAGQIAERTRSDADYAFDEAIPGETGYDRNGLNQYPAVDAPESGAATLTYDARGNFLRYNAPGDDHERIYVYDQLNRLTSARLGGESVAEATLFSYDPLGRLYQVTDQASGESRRNLWDGASIVAQYEGASGSTVRRRWVYAPGSLGAPLIQYWNAQTVESSRQYAQTDERGSVVSYSNPSGALGVINTYDPYGMPGAGNDGSFQYAGQLWLPEAGLYYMRNRMYDPALGRFAQTDPIGYAGGMNLYAYSGNDPANFIDPWGLSNCPVGFRMETGSRLCRPNNPHGASLAAGAAARGGGGTAGGRGGGGGSQSGAYYKVTRTNPDTKVSTSYIIWKPYSSYAPDSGGFQFAFWAGEQGYLTFPRLNEESMYYHYNYGGGEDVCLSSGQFASIANSATLGPVDTRSAPDSQGNYTQQISLYGSSYAFLFGTATGRFNSSGSMTGFTDRFDLDAKSWGTRDFGAEIVTRGGNIMSEIMTLGTAEPYDVNYPCP